MNIFSSSQGTTGKQGSVTIYLEGEPSMTRCQVLQKHLRENNSRRYIAQCDAQGRFLPTQCYSPLAKSYSEIIKEQETNQNEIENEEAHLEDDAIKCWCVDETGRKTQPTVYFTKGERQCGKFN